MTLYFHFLVSLTSRVSTWIIVGGEVASEVSCAVTLLVVLLTGADVGVLAMEMFMVEFPRSATVLVSVTLGFPRLPVAGKTSKTQTDL